MEIDYLKGVRREGGGRIHEGGLAGDVGDCAARSHGEYLQVSRAVVVVRGAVYSRIDMKMFRISAVGELPIAKIPPRCRHSLNLRLCPAAAHAASRRFYRGQAGAMKLDAKFDARPQKSSDETSRAPYRLALSS